MKRFFSLVCLVAVYGLFVAGCSKSDFHGQEEVQPAQKSVCFTAKAPESKTVFGDKSGNLYPTIWNSKDKIAVSLNFGSPVYATANPKNEGRAATFNADMPAAEVPALFYAVSPSTAYVEMNKAQRNVTMNLPVRQKPTQASVDEATHIMAAQSSIYTTWPEQVELSFSHMAAYGKFSLKNFPETVTVSTIDLEASKKIAGSFYYYPLTGAIDDTPATNTITIDASNLTASNAGKVFWFSFSPVDLSAGGQLKVSIHTDAGVYRKVITFPSNKGNFQAGRIASFNIDMNGISPVAEDDPYAIYVSPTGNDFASGTSAEPLKTLQNAVNSLVPGIKNKIYLMDGVWNEGFTLKESGSSSSPIVIMAAPGANPVIDGGNGEGWSMDTDIGRKLLSDFANTNAGLPSFNSDKGLVVLENASYVEIKGITVTGSAESGIFCGKGSSHITIENCTVTNCVAPGICFGADNTPSTNIKVLNNYVKNCAQRSREAISLRTVDVFEVAYNTVEKVIKESIDVKSGCTEGTIHHNRIINSGHCGIYMDAGYANTKPQRNIEVYCNSVVSAYSTAICVASEAGNNCSGIKIYNNLAYIAVGEDNNGCGIKVALNSSDYSGLIKDVYIYNNTVAFFKQQGIYVNYPTIENIVIANNISVMTLDNIALSSANMVPATQVQIVRNLYFGGKTSNAGIDAINADPQFTDFANGVFTLKENSPAIDAAQGTWVASTDFTDKARPQGKEDIGAFER